jgi:Domain of unknown function (DUF4412)
MKKVWLFPLLLVAIVAGAQSFEGTVTWSMNYEINDPAKKAEMEKSQKSMNDPANQEKMKKLQEQMNTPEMKQMMESNPQMKARMEGALKAMQGGGSIMPKSLIVKIKGNNSCSKMDGGMMASETLYQGDKKQAYLVDRSAKTFTVLQRDSAVVRRPDTMQHSIQKTTESMKILDHTCTKYIVTMISRDTVTQVFWTTTEIKGLDMRSMSRQRMGNGGQPMFYEGIAGVPLRIEMGTKQMNMVMEVTSIKNESLPATDFIIPDDFKETKGFMR